MSDESDESKLEEVLRKFNNPTPEEKKKMAEDEQSFNEALMRAYEMGGEEDTPVQPFECPVCGSTEYTPHPASNGRLGPGGRSCISSYECGGCSVTFNDLAKFSNRK